MQPQLVDGWHVDVWPHAMRRPGPAAACRLHVDADAVAAVCAAVVCAVASVVVAAEVVAAAAIAAVAVDVVAAAAAAGWPALPDVVHDLAALRCTAH